MTEWSQELSKLEKKLGYTFKDRTLLEASMTHPSFFHLHPDSDELRKTEQDYQRLEFLGDAVLGMLLAEALYTEFAEEREGWLAQARSALAKGDVLADLATQIGIGGALRLSPADERAQGRKRPSTLENAFEALIGAIYLDSDLETTRNLVERWYGKLSKRLNRLLSDHNPKGVLQERLHAERQTDNIEYTLKEAEGPDHRKQFKVEVLVDGECMGRGQGFSKKEAEEAAARKALSKLDK